MNKHSLDNVYIEEVLYYALEGRSIEVHLEVGRVPTFRRKGELHLRELDMYEVPRADIVQRLIYDVLHDEQIVELERTGAIMMRYVTIDGSAAYHTNISHEDGIVEANFHLVSPRPSVR